METGRWPRQRGGMKTLTPLFLILVALAAQAAPERIRPDNIQRLAVAWTYDTRDPTTPLRPGGDPPAFEATPAYADGRLYVSTPLGTVVALAGIGGIALTFGGQRPALSREPRDRPVAETVITESRTALPEDLRLPSTYARQALPPASAPDPTPTLTRE